MKKQQSFSFEMVSDGPRQAYRARVPGLMAKNLATQKLYPVQDISAGGFSLEAPEGDLPSGKMLEFDVLLKDHVIIAGLKAEQSRNGNGVTGLKFTDLTRRQEERLDKLVLEVQKHFISKSKQDGGSHIDDEHKT